MKENLLQLSKCISEMHQVVCIFKYRTVVCVVQCGMGHKELMSQ